MLEVLLEMVVMVALAEEVLEIALDQLVVLVLLIKDIMVVVLLVMELLMQEEEEVLEQQVLMELAMLTLILKVMEVKEYILI